MRLPGTRYQEHGWEQVRKLLGHCSLQVFRDGDVAAFLRRENAADLLDAYVDGVCAALRRSALSARFDAPGNSYGESVFELALGLAWELRAHPAFFDGLLAALAGEHARAGAFWQGPNAEAMLRKKVNDMYAGLRDKVDADNYQVALGSPCSPNRMYTYRMLDTAYGEIAALFADWRQHAAQVAAILGRDPGGMPIEARQMKSIAGCRAEWVIRWSETLERFAGSPGPLHTKSKRFASLKNSPDKIAAMMAEIGDYEELSSNMDSADSWSGDAGAAAAWLEDYWRVLDAPLPDDDNDRILPEAVDPFSAEDEEDLTSDDQPAEGEPVASTAADEALAVSLSLPPRFVVEAAAAQEAGSWTLRQMAGDSLAIRLAVYQTLLGPADDSYPAAWRDPATNELPTLQQLAALDGISMPTLRKRRNEAIGRLQAATRHPAGATTRRST